MGRYTRGKQLFTFFFLNDHMISLTTTTTMSMSPQKLKQQVVYWLNLASVMRWIPCPITPKADTSYMFKKQCENAVRRVGHLFLYSMERNKTMMRLPQQYLAADFWKFLLWPIFKALSGPSFLHYPITAQSLHCIQNTSLRQRITIIPVQWMERGESDSLRCTSYISPCFGAQSCKSHLCKDL